MKQIWVKNLYLFVKRKVKNFSYQKAIVFLLCLGLASFLWLLNSLEKHYTSKISVPVSYIEFPKDKQLSGTLPQKLDLVVDAYGYTLLSYQIRLAFSPILLNVSELIENSLERGKKFRYIVFTVNHKDEIEKQISSEIRILSIKPDSLVFNFSKIVSRKIHVKPCLKLTFENQYALASEPSTFPDSVLVSGPKNILDTLKFISTNFMARDKLSHSLEENIYLQPIQGLKFDNQELKLTIPVEQNTEVTFDVPIQILNKPADVVLKTFPGKVKVTCRIGLGKYKRLDYRSFRAFINFDSISNNDTRLPVSLESLSNVALSVTYSPKEVEYIQEHEK